MRQFIWDGKTFHWVNWNTVTQPRGRGGLGLHTARETNVALLGKHVWDLLHHQEKLWVQMLAAKFLKDSHILAAKPVTGMPPIWSAILKSMECLKSGFRFRVGKGDISIWYDKWLDDDHLCHLVPYVHIQDTQMQIKDIFFNGQWLWNLLATPIPLDIKMKMQSQFLDEVSDDTLIWGNSNSGKYTASSAYQWITQVQCPTQVLTEERWSWLWKQALPENIKHFLWLIFHNSLPANTFRVSRHVGLDASCQKCGASQETCTHVLRDCVAARRVWDLTPLGRDQDFYSQDYMSWLRKNIFENQGSLFVVVCWFIWRARNAEIFTNSKWCVWYVLNQTYALHDLIIKTLGKTNKTHTFREVSWLPPAESCMELNVDGSSLAILGEPVWGFNSE